MSRIISGLWLVLLGAAPLYAAVNNPLNAGARIELVAGTYLLTPTDPSGAARPNHGTLLLQANMDLVGEQEIPGWERGWRLGPDRRDIWDKTPRSPLIHPNCFGIGAEEQIALLG